VTTVAIVSRHRETRLLKIMGNPFCERQAGFCRSQTRESRHSATLCASSAAITRKSARAQPALRWRASTCIAGRRLRQHRPDYRTACAQAQTCTAADAGVPLRDVQVLGAG
jgi:hypothetical protein